MVDYLPSDAQYEINLRHGVWRSLIIRGLLYRTELGLEITPEGEALLRSGNFIVYKPKPKKRLPMINGKSARYRVSRIAGGWAVIDLNKDKIRMHNDVIETHKTRTAARLRTRELNLKELERNPATGGAA